MATDIDTLAGQLMLTQSFLTHVILTHPKPAVLVEELEKAVKSSMAMTTLTTNGASEMAKSIQQEAEHWHRILEEQIVRMAR